MCDDAIENESVVTASRHALGWLVVGNSIGLLLSLLLLKPEWQPGRLTYGHWVPLHLNAQLYGWTALPLVGWLFSMFEVDRGPARRWGPPMIWAWTSALALACFRWLSGETSGKIFLDWRNGSLWGFLVALGFLWAIFAVTWWRRKSEWGSLRRRISLTGLIGLAFVPVVMWIAASPKTYPPIDRTTGGPTGSSLLGSTLVVIGLMLLLPRVLGNRGEGKARWGTWVFFGLSWLVFGLTEIIGGGHFDAWQIGAMGMLLPWAWLIPRDWSGFVWPGNSGVWRMCLVFWWVVLVLAGVAMYQPGVLDHLKFTQGLVAHSHLAMAGFTTSFCALLIANLTGRPVGGRDSILVWHGGVITMIGVLAWMGWREGNGSDWMIVQAGWREVGLILRMLSGVAMLAASVVWMNHFSKS
jgi:cytochrome c oxidase cbb3-type subunit I